MTTVTVGQRVIGEGQPCYIVAELSANHRQRLDDAVALIRAARRSGADAVKLQTYTPDTLTIDCDREWFRIPAGSLWAGQTLYELYRQAYTPWEWHPDLQVVAREEGLDCFSTPFDVSAVEFLERLDMPAYKVGSFELIDLPLLRRIGQTGKPVIASTGMASREEIEEAVGTLRSAGASQLVLLKCTSAYPASAAEMNLRTLPHLAASFRVPVGLSDHTPGVDVAVAAVALGACVVEKHFTLRRADGGPDSAFSLEPDEFARLVRGIRTAEQALGTVTYARSSGEARNLAFRRSLFVVHAVKQGEPFTAENVRSIRPGQGLHPRHLEQVLGQRAARDIERGTPLSWELVGARL